jgi:hypothetical protein
MMVMMMAITPSLNASSLFFPIRAPRVARETSALHYLT